MFFFLISLGPTTYSAGGLSASVSDWTLTQSVNYGILAVTVSSPEHVVSGPSFAANVNISSSLSPTITLQNISFTITVWSFLYFSYYHLM